MVINKPAVNLRFGISLIPGTTDVLPAGITSFTVLDWKGFTLIPYRAGATFLVEGEDYSWNKETAVFALLQSGDEFGYNELLHVEFEPLVIGSGVAVDDTDGCGSNDWSQYPHTLRYKTRNQVTLVTESFERKGRLEESGSTIAGINAQGNNITAIFYESLPAEPIPIGQEIEIYNSEVLLTANTVKNFVKGFFNARIWL